MKPRAFIGSSTESLEIAYALQENLEDKCESTVWNQGIFELSKNTLDSLLEVFDKFDFGIFIFAPDDITIVRNETKRSVRDNVIFELGLFVGRIGKERCFIITPKVSNKMELPTDLLGITTATYDSERQDDNMGAALGPVSHKILKTMKKFSHFKRETKIENNESKIQEEIIRDENGQKAKLSSWMHSSEFDIKKDFNFSEIDKKLGLEPGATKSLIKEVASREGYYVEYDGETVFLINNIPYDLEF